MSSRKTAREYFNKVMGDPLTLLDMLPKETGDMNTEIGAILKERETTHGDFMLTAITSQGIKCALRSATNWNLLTYPQKEALDNIAQKMSRIVEGNSDTLDHWKDIQGYAELAIIHTRGAKTK